MDGFDRTEESVWVFEWFVDKHMEKCLFYTLLLQYALPFALILVLTALPHPRSLNRQRR
jgi:hypothetical protein